MENFETLKVFTDERSQNHVKASTSSSFGAMTADQATHRSINLSTECVTDNSETINAIVSSSGNTNDSGKSEASC